MRGRRSAPRRKPLFSLPKPLITYHSDDEYEDWFIELFTDGNIKIRYPDHIHCLTIHHLLMGHMYFTPLSLQIKIREIVKEYRRQKGATA